MKYSYPTLNMTIKENDKAKQLGIFIIFICANFLFEYF